MISTDLSEANAMRLRSFHMLHEDRMKSMRLKPADGSVFSLLLSSRAWRPDRSFLALARFLLLDRTSVFVAGGSGTCNVADGPGELLCIFSGASKICLVVR